MRGGLREGELDPVFCLDEGLLTGAHLALQDPAIAWTIRATPLPCAHLSCADCGEEVRVFEGVGLARLPRSRAEHEALFASSPEAQGLLTRVGAGARSRTYACRCDAIAVGGVRGLRQGGPDGWRCAGHARAQASAP